MQTHVITSRTAYYLELAEQADAVSGASANRRLRERFAESMSRAAESPSAEKALAEYRRLVAEEQRKQSETKAAKHAAAKAVRAQRRKETLRRKKTRKNVGVTSGRQPRRGNMRLTQPVSQEEAA